MSFKFCVMKLKTEDLFGWFVVVGTFSTSFTTITKHTYLYICEESKKNSRQYQNITLFFMNISLHI